MKHRRTAVLVVLGLLAAAGSAWAHHSLQSEYDIDKSITLKGTISRVEWVNPHVYLYLDVKGPDGKIAAAVVTLHSSRLARDKLVLAIAATTLASKSPPRSRSCPRRSTPIAFSSRP